MGEYSAPAGLVDRLVAGVDDCTLTAIKGLSFREDYLRDHFPGYPLMPGALQLQVMFEAGAWLMRRRAGFPAADYLPCGVHNARYARHVRPGDQLTVTVTLEEEDGGVARFKGVGEVAAGRTIIARFELCRYEATWDGLSPAARNGRIEALRAEGARLLRGALPAYTCAHRDLPPGAATRPRAQMPPGTGAEGLS